MTLRMRERSEKLRIVTLPVAVTKPPLVQLPVGIPGQLGEKVDGPRTLVVGKGPPAMFEQLLFEIRPGV